MYRITNWDNLYETAETRKIKFLRWIPLRNRLDDDGASELLEHKDGVAHLGLWCALLQIASSDTFKRGYLTKSGPMCRIGHNVQSIARKLRTTEKLVDVAINRLLQIGWLQEVADSCLNSEVNDCNTQEITGTTQEKTRAELNRIELNRKEEDKKCDAPQTGSLAKSDFGFVLKSGETYWLLESDYQKFLTLYPNHAVEIDLGYAAHWLDINPSKRKTVSGMLRFLSGWLKRSTPTQSIIPEIKPAKPSDFTVALTVIEELGWKLVVDMCNLQGVSSEADLIRSLRDDDVLPEQVAALHAK